MGKEGGKKEREEGSLLQFYHLVQGGTREIQQMALIHFSKYDAELKTELFKLCISDKKDRINHSWKQTHFKIFYYHGEIMLLSYSNAHSWLASNLQFSLPILAAGGK